jgi:predicted amidohydrolase
MRIGIIQTKQNKLYDFNDINFYITKEKAKKLQHEMIQQNFKLIDEACNLNCDLIVTSEAIDFCRTSSKIDGIIPELFPNPNDELFIKLSEYAKKANSYLIAGVYNRPFDNNKIYNSAYIYNRNGELIDVYDKIHLAGIENDTLVCGNKYVVISMEFGNVGVCICWDMQFPEVSRELVLGGADLIICLTWGWEQIYGHARAYENGVFVASSMSVPYNGIIDGIRNPSEVISPEGKVLARACNNEAQILTCDINLKNCLPYKELRMSNRHSSTYKNICK